MFIFVTSKRGLFIEGFIAKMTLEDSVAFLLYTTPLAVLS